MRLPTPGNCVAVAAASTSTTCTPDGCEQESMEKRNKHLILKYLNVQKGVSHQSKADLVCLKEKLCTAKK